MSSTLSSTQRYTCEEFYDALDELFNDEMTDRSFQIDLETPVMCEAIENWLSDWVSMFNHDQYEVIDWEHEDDKHFTGVRITFDFCPPDCEDYETAPDAHKNQFVEY
jgi:hypothetical protein